MWPKPYRNRQNSRGAATQHKLKENSIITHPRHIENSSYHTEARLTQIQEEEHNSALQTYRETVQNSAYNTDAHFDFGHPKLHHVTGMHSTTCLHCCWKELRTGPSQFISGVLWEASEDWISSQNCLPDHHRTTTKRAVCQLRSLIGRKVI